MAPEPRNWVKKAVAKKPKYHGRLALKKKPLINVSEGDGVLIATDGVRAHYHFDDAYCVQAIDTDDDCKPFPHEGLLTELETARSGDVIAAFSPYAVRKACTAALTFFKKKDRNDFITPPFIYVFFGKTRMSIGTARDAVGSMRFTLIDGSKWKLAKSARVQHYELLVDDQHQVYFNPILLEQALAGMGDSVTMRFNSNNASHHFKSDDGMAEAVVMPLNPTPLTSMYKPVFKDFQYGYEFRADNKV